MSAADIPIMPASILKRKSNVSRAVDVTSRHTMETNVDTNGTATASIVKRKIPSTQALVIVPVLPEKRFAHTGKVYEDNFTDDDKRWDEHWKDHKEFKGNKSALLECPIYDTTFSEVGDGVIIPPPPFRKAPPRDARELGLAKKGKSPAGIAAISKRKEKTRSELLKLPKDRESLKQKIEEEEQKLLKNLGEFHSRDARELGLAKKSKSTEPAGIAAISEQKRKIKSELFKPSTRARHNSIIQ
jgi:hypothetical protein